MVLKMVVHLYVYISFVGTEKALQKLIKYVLLGLVSMQSKPAGLSICNPVFINSLCLSLFCLCMTGDC